MLGEHWALVTVYHGLQLVLSKRIRIGKRNIIFNPTQLDSLYI